VKEWILYDTLTLYGQLGLVDRPVRPVLADPATPASPIEATGSDAEQANIDAYGASVDAFNAHDASRFGDSLADGLVWTEPTLPNDLGKADEIASAQDLWSGFSNITRKADVVWAAGDYVVASGTMTGKNDGTSKAFSANATGKTIDATF